MPIIGQSNTLTQLAQDREFSRMTIMQLAILAEVGDRSTPVTMIDVSERARVSYLITKKIVSILVDRGLLLRTSRLSQDRRRVPLIQATPTGRRFIEILRQPTQLVRRTAQTALEEARV